VYPRRIVVMTTASVDVERVFRDSGALREGHFILASGRHSPLYLEKFQVLQHPAETERLCSAMASWARPLGIDSVAGPTTGGIILAHEVARQLGVRAIYAERRESGAGREFRRGFALAPDERVLVVDDIMTTGGSVQETIEAVRSAGGTVVAVSVLVDRSGGAARLDIPVQSLWRLDVPSYASAECPLCAKGVPATHPGTSPAPVAAPR
jgi:orotate phosphoribosyltransferase